VATASAPHESRASGGRSGDGAAAARTEALFAEYGRTVAGLCRALLRDGAEAEDAAQQTFLSAHRALLNGSVPREPAAWLATIARNECWARIKSRMREPLPSDSVAAEAPSSSDPLAEALRRADLAALWRAIEALPRAQRDALLLREFAGLSYEELGAALAVSGSAVESLLFRARARLRVQLKAAYAAVTGASWVEALARLLAGGGAPAAAKVAVLGVGAAAIGSSAVVVPRAFDNHQPSQPTRSRQVVVHRVARRMPAVVADVVAPPVVHTPVVRAPAHEVRRRAAPVAERQRRGGDDRGAPSTSDDGTATRGRSSAEDGSHSDATLPVTPTVTVQSHDDGGGAGGTDGGGGQSGGDDGGSGSSDGGGGGG